MWIIRPVTKIMNKFGYFFILPAALLISCEKDDYLNSYPSEIRFDISYHLLEGKRISCIDFDKKGNAYIGSGTELYYQYHGEIKSYNTGFPVLDLAVAPDQTVWIGTNGGGLCHFEDNKFTWYNMANSGLPRDVVMNVEAGPDGTIWFASCAHKLGGLGIYDGKRFTFLTPENSPLNQNIIDDIEIGPDGNVYIATSGTVGRTNIYHISGNSWKCLGKDEGTFYWAKSFTIGPSGSIYIVEDFSLSSTWQTDKLYKFDNDRWKNIDIGDQPLLSFFTAIKADKRNYCWLTSSEGNESTLLVFDGSKWFRSPEGLFPDDLLITTLETDSENNIWAGTWSDGIFIINQ